MACLIFDFIFKISNVWNKSKIVLKFPFQPINLTLNMTQIPWPFSKPKVIGIKNGTEIEYRQYR
jgi:hypothetical protein